MIVLLTDAAGKLICFGVLPGQNYDLMAMSDLLQDLSFERLIDYKAFDSGALLVDLAERGTEAMIPSKTN